MQHWLGPQGAGLVWGQAKYKGELRAVHDGAGLCSPGRWPVGKRSSVVPKR